MSARLNDWWREQRRRVRRWRAEAGAERYLRESGPLYVLGLTAPPERECLFALRATDPGWKRAVLDGPLVAAAARVPGVALVKILEADELEAFWEREVGR